MFISFEGIDFSGKSTQCSRAETWFEERGRHCMRVREPGGTAVSERIRDILLDTGHTAMDAVTEMLLFSAARSQVVRESIAPALERGLIVLADRFHDSTTAYQGYGRQIDLDDIMHVHRLAMHGVVPDLTLYFDIDPAVSERRRIALGRGADRMEQADRAFFNRVRNGYLELARREPGRILVIDGTPDPDTVFLQVTQAIQSRA